MNTARVFHNGRQIVLAKVADSFIKRLIGLIFKKDLKDEEGLLICPCAQVHTFGMKYCIDVVFLSQDNIILGIEQRIKPKRISRYIRGSKKVLEMKEGMTEIYGLKKGDNLKICYES